MSEEKRKKFLRDIDAACALLMNTLCENGLRLEFKDLTISESYCHNLQHPEDPFCVTFRVPTGYLFRYGVHIPVGQHPDRPDEVEVFCSVEEPQVGTPPYSDGFRLVRRVARHGWYMRHWSIAESGNDLGDVRRDILGQNDFRPATSIVPNDKAPLILARIAKLCMKSA